MSYRSSVLYAFVRGRQLEGTYPGDRSTGIWPITDARIRRGWGSPPEEMWPESDEWPPSEPPNIDAAAKAYRIGRYQRVRTLLECKAVLAGLAPVLVSLEITDKWGTAPSGRIRALSPNESPCGWHSVLLVGYDDGKSEFTFASGSTRELLRLGLDDNRRITSTCDSARISGQLPNCRRSGQNRRTWL